GEDILEKDCAVAEQRPREEVREGDAGRAVGGVDRNQMTADDVVGHGGLSFCLPLQEAAAAVASVRKFSVGTWRVYTGPMGDEATPRVGAGLFPETRWSRIVAARERPELRRAVLDELCATRWQPLYLHLRKQGVGAALAQDVVQGFLVHLLER